MEVISTNNEGEDEYKNNENRNDNKGINANEPVYDFSKEQGGYYNQGEIPVNVFEAKMHGDGWQYFSILIVNWVLTVLSLGFYYPWARAKTLRYIYGETEFGGSRFTFHGTGKEMFKGFIKAIALLAGIALLGNLGRITGSLTLAVVGGLLYFLGIMLIIPLALHGGMRYRMSRTSWRGIHFGYRGKLGELFGICVKGFLLSVFTLGIYSSWFAVDLRRYMHSNMRLGNCHLDFEGQGSSLFWINLKGVLLFYPTLGIYTFWYIKNLNNYYINNTVLYQDGRKSQFNSSLTVGNVFEVTIVNFFLTIVTFGLYMPWAMLREMRMVIDNVQLEGQFVPEAVVQTEENYADATGEDLLDMLDIGLDF